MYGICFLHLVDLYGKWKSKYTSPTDPLVLNLLKFAHGLPVIVTTSIITCSFCRWYLFPSTTVYYLGDNWDNPTLNLYSYNQNISRTSRRSDFSWRCKAASPSLPWNRKTKRDEVFFTDPKNQTTAAQKSDLLGHGDEKEHTHTISSQNGGENIVMNATKNHLFLTKQREGFHPKKPKAVWYRSKLLFTCW